MTAPVIETLASDLFAETDDREFCVTFFADAILSATLRWLSKPRPDPPEQYLNRLLVRGRLSSPAEGEIPCQEGAGVIG